MLSEIKKITDRRCHQRVDKLYCELPIRKKIFERMSKKPFLRRKQDVMAAFERKFKKGNQPLEAEVSLRTLTKKPLTKAFLATLTGNLKEMVKGSRDDLKELIGHQNDVILFFLWDRSEKKRGQSLIGLSCCFRTRLRSARPGVC
jgi:hypothetical protein